MNDLFTKHQFLLRIFANSPSGRAYLRIPHTSRRIVKLSPNSYHQLLKAEQDVLTIRSTFLTSNYYAEKLSSALLVYDLIHNNMLGFSKAYAAFTSLVKNGAYNTLHTVDAFTASTGEGRIDRGNDAVFADCRNNTTGISTGAVVGCYTSQGFYIVRGFLPFDTSSIGGGATITAGVNTLGLFRDDSQDGSAFQNGSTTRVELVQTSQASNTALATADYDALAFVSGGNFNFADTTNVTLKTLTLNTTADGWISKTGFTKLGIITGKDFDNSAPVAQSNSIWFQDRADANPPTLTVTYIAAGTSGLQSKYW